MGDRANTRVPAPESLVTKLPEEMAPNSVVVAYQVDGTAEGVSLYNETVSQEKNSFEQKSVTGQVIADLRQKLDEAKGGAPEANTLGAIGSAARALRDVTGEKTLFIADSMLSTAGVLQFQIGLLNTAPEDVVASVNKDELPDLKDVDVEVYGAGEVREPQASLPESKRKKLEDIWKSLLTEAGAKSVVFRSGLDSNATTGPWPSVAIVPMAAPIATPVPQSTCIQVLPESLIEFVPDTSDFVDPETARKTIGGVASGMRGCPGSISVVGTTSSWGTKQGRQQTSQDRAERVRDALAEALGVNASQIAAKGVGMEFPEYVNDRDPSGRLIPVAAAQNRTVRISATQS